jgi:hypothetical protein
VECRRIGLCCTRDHLRCIFLEVTGKLGEVDSTRCIVYGLRKRNMPVAMVDSEDRVVGIGTCLANAFPAGCCKDQSWT